MRENEAICSENGISFGICTQDELSIHDTFGNQIAVTLRSLAKKAPTENYDPPKKTR
jgi:hypothetical protein